MNGKNELPDFQITNINHFWRIINKKKNILSTLKLEETARSFQFEPSIIGTKTNLHYEINTTFHLAFPDKKKVLRPMLAISKYLLESLGYKMKNADFIEVFKI